MLIASSLDSLPGKGGRTPMNFSSKWGEGNIFNWYHKLPSKMMTQLEIRITNTAVPHRFVLAQMSNGQTCRFDRRPLDPNALRLLAETAGKPERRAADEATLIDSAEKALVLIGSRQEVEIKLPQQTDVELILSACYAMAQDPKASIYALREYNCYFFAWTIVMVVMRHTLPFTLPSPEDVQSRLLLKLENFTAALTDKIVDALLQIVLDTITEFRRATGRSLYKGLSKRELAVWGLPIPVVRTLLHQCLKLRLHFGLEAQLRARVSSQLEGQAPRILQHVLKNQCTVGKDIEDRLWLFDLNQVFDSPVKNQILETLWDSLLEALSEGYGNLSQEFGQDISQLPMIYRLKYLFFGKNVVQFSQLWNAALHAALPAARAAGHGQYTSDKSHGMMFDLAFEAGCKAALLAAREVVRETSLIINDHKRDEMWEEVWKVWDDVWTVTRINAQTMVVNLIDTTMQEIVDWVTSDVVKELGNSKTQMIDGTVQFKKKISAKGMTLDSFQSQIREFIRTVPGQTPAHQKNIEAAMANAWDKSRSTYVPLSTLRRKPDELLPSQVIQVNPWLQLINMDESYETIKEVMSY